MLMIKRFWRNTAIAAGIVLGLTIPFTSTADDGRPTDFMPPSLTASWWQWGFSIPLSTRPLNTDLDTMKQKALCPVGQHGDYWFLGGFFVANTSNLPGKVQVVRECIIPFGKQILIPTINAECSTAEGNANPSDSFTKKASDLHKCAKELADGITRNVACFGPALPSPEKINLTTAAGCPQGLKPLKVQRVSTLLPFSVSFPSDNVLRSTIGDPPTINPSLSQADGFWALVQPPAPGYYTLATLGDVGGIFVLQVTYTIKVVPVSAQ